MSREDDARSNGTENEQHGCVFGQPRDVRPEMVLSGPCQRQLADAVDHDVDDIDQVAAVADREVHEEIVQGKYQHDPCKAADQDGTYGAAVSHINGCADVDGHMDLLVTPDT